MTPQMLTIGTDQMQVTLARERGAEIRYLGRPDGANLLAWYDWSEPVPASKSHSYGSDLLDWLSEYRGGWQELFPNAGAPCEVAGVHLPFHGEVSAARWDVLDQSDTSVTVACSARLPLRLERRMSIEGAVLRIEETATNTALVPTSLLWGHHPAWRAEDDLVIDLPAATVVADSGYSTELVDVVPGSEGVWPHLPGRHGSDVDLAGAPSEAVQRLLYLPNYDAGWCALRYLEEGVGVAYCWDTSLFRHLWLWREAGGREFPWYGRASVVALEPHVAYPGDGLAAAHERGDAVTLEPGRSLETWLSIRLIDADDRPVTGVSRDGSVTR